MRVKYLNSSVFFGRYDDHFSMSDNHLDNKRRILESIPIKLRKIVDGFMAEDFARNIHGWPMNDLVLLQKAQTQQELDYALQRLRECSIVGIDNSGKSVRDVLDSVLPRYVQTPAELSQYAEFYTSIYDKQTKLEDSKDGDSKDDDSKDDDPKDDDSK